MERLRAWAQTPDAHISGPDDALRLIHNVGLATVYPASPEVANLFHAYVGDPNAKTDSKWDSPSGEVYAWRWTIGRRAGAFYGTVVRKRPTFIRWDLLPAVLRLVGDLRTPDELYDFGVISSEAYRIAQVLEDGGAPLGTGEIRKRADFPMGKESNSAYHKALAELENRLLVTSEFSQSDEEGTKHHGLMFLRRPEDVKAADKMSTDGAMTRLLRAYLPAARYVVPASLALHLRVPKDEMVACLRKLSDEGFAVASEAPGVKAPVWLHSCNPHA